MGNEHLTPDIPEQFQDDAEKVRLHILEKTTADGLHQVAVKQERQKRVILRIIDALELSTEDAKLLVSLLDD